MLATRHKRQIVLFLLAILAPAGVLIWESGRLMYQERELSVTRSADQRRAAVEQLRRELGARLEAIRLQEINRQIRSSGADAAKDPASPAVVFTAIVKGDALVMPWGASPPQYSAGAITRRRDPRTGQKRLRSGCLRVPSRIEHGARRCGDRRGAVAYCKNTRKGW